MQFGAAMPDGGERTSQGCQGAQLSGRESSKHQGSWEPQEHWCGGGLGESRGNGVTDSTGDRLGRLVGVWFLFRGREAGLEDFERGMATPTCVGKQHSGAVWRTDSRETETQQPGHWRGWHNRAG